MEFSEIIEKERQIFRETSWYPIMKGFVESKDFEKPFAEACEILNEGGHFYPSFKNTFNAFKYCELSNFKVLLLNGAYPMEDLITLNGLALGNTLHSGSSYYNTLKSFSHVKTGITPMEEYARQGVLCLNDALFVTRDVKRCKKIWRPFINYFLDMIKDMNYVSVKTIGIDMYCDVIFGKLNEYFKPSKLQQVNTILKEKGLDEIKW